MPQRSAQALGHRARGAAGAVFAIYIYVMKRRIGLLLVAVTCIAASTTVSTQDGQIAELQSVCGIQYLVMEYLST